MLERTRQRNPVGQSTTSHIPTIAPAQSFQMPTAPTTPAAAKLLRQPMPQYHPPSLISKPSTAVPTVSAVPSSVIKNPDTTVTLPIAAPTPAAAPAAVDEPSLSSSVLGEKRKSTFQQEDVDGEELSAADSFSKDDPEYLTKVAAEEDKRRRNTAASARFRQKKKLREQALEQTAREQTVRAEQLENRVRELEMEVRWLRGLIVEKDTRLQAATMTLQRLDAF